MVNFILRANVVEEKRFENCCSLKFCLETFSSD